ncbi:hypothetical protein N0V83_005244 [Neocucurbitaria cava]|uniref:Amine oxidase n=1 Tax=Neocucurbitaria cava TaxID=798079 RepID=A0A9W9CMR1_9PLEO|nr:hypothetical protein N0V83_005244 [Neocucurbitaria cava]
MELCVPFWDEDGRVIAWAAFYGVPTSGLGSPTLLALGVSVRLDLTGRNWQDWKATGWYSLGKYYESTDQFRNATFSGTFQKPQPNVDGNWTSTDKHGDPLPLDELPPPVSVAQGTPRFKLDTNEDYVSWMDFSFYFSVSRDVGLSLFDIQYKGQRLAYELSLQEAVTLYTGSEPFASQATFFDTVDGLGSSLVTLVRGYDCPSHATYLNATYSEGNTTKTQADAICVFEFDAGYPIRRHSYPTNYASVAKNIMFTVRTISTVGNYDFMIEYQFFYDGAIEVSVRASGFISATYWDGNGDYGFHIHDYLSGSLHDHVLTFKADLDVLGRANTLQKVELAPESTTYPWSQGIIHDTFKASRSFVDKESSLSWADNDAAIFAVVNKQSPNRFGEFPGYRMKRSAGTSHFTPKKSTNVQKAGASAYYDFYITKQKDTEPRAADSYNQFAPEDPLVDFTKFLDGDSIDQEDVVMWFNLGMHHMPHTGDLPNTMFTSAHSAMRFEPFNYLEGDPSVASNQQVKVHYSDVGSVDGVEEFGKMTANADGDPAAAASDALSLHTIADREDAYATQEQEDGDFALALQLEDEESHNPIGNSTPYRDDPDTEENSEDAVPPRYRDDPDAPISDEEEEANIEAQQQRATTAKRRRFCLPKPSFSSAQNLLPTSKSLRKLPWCALSLALFILAIATGVTLISIHLFHVSPKERAWRSSHSQNFDLKLPALYPALEAGASDECKAGWEKYAASLKCQQEILSPVWDNGDADAVRKARLDPWAYSEWVCDEFCRRSITRMDTPLRNTCGKRTDRFDVVNYGKDGKMYFSKEEKLPQGPVEAQRALIERYDRLCARPEEKRHESSEWGTCAADVWMKWGVVDGRNERTLNSLDKFLDATSKNKVMYGGKVTGSVQIVDGEKRFEVDTGQRRVGPGVGETNCGFCTGDWLERKMRSFEYGALIDSTTGEAMGLAAFDEVMTNTLKRCETKGAKEALERVHKKWTQYGWWCSGKPCHEDRNTTAVVRALLHGMREDDWPLPELRQMAKRKGAPKSALNTLHDTLHGLPCSIWFNENDAVRDIIPSDYRIHHLCSDYCRNAIDRAQQQHGTEFAAAATEKPPYNIFHTWELALMQVDKICRTRSPSAVVRDSTMFCAPGYATLGHPEYIFALSEPSKREILSAFSTALLDLEKRLPRFIPRPGNDAESQRVLLRRGSESVCNGCAAELLVGRNPDYKDRVSEFLEDKDIDGKEYTAVAKKWFVTCARMAGTELSWRDRKRAWEAIGLDRYD